MALFRATPRITRKFILYLMTVSILPLPAVGYVSYHAARATILAQTRQGLETLVKGQARSLALQFGQVEDLIANLSGVETITSAAAQDAPGDDFSRLATQARIGCRGCNSGRGPFSP